MRTEDESIDECKYVDERKKQEFAEKDKQIGEYYKQIKELEKQIENIDKQIKELKKLIDECERWKLNNKTIKIEERILIKMTMRNIEAIMEQEELTDIDRYHQIGDAIIGSWSKKVHSDWFWEEEE